MTSNTKESHGVRLRALKGSQMRGLGRTRSQADALNCYDTEEDEVYYLCWTSFIDNPQVYPYKRESLV